MDNVNHQEQQSLAEIVNSVLKIDDCDLINKVVDILVTPKKRPAKKNMNFYSASVITH